MNKINRAFFTGLAIVALLPLAVPLIQVLVTLSPALLAGAILFGSFSWRPLRRAIRAVISGTAELLLGIFTGTGRGLYAFGEWMFRKRSHSGRFMGFFERRLMLRFFQQGLLIDGRSARLSEKATYESVIIQGGVGRGKSSTFVMPNLLKPPRHKPSFVLFDTSGEIYQHTSGYLASRGYTIRALNLMEPSRSETYNPLANATTPHALAEMAKMLVAAANPGAGRSSHDPFWEQAAEKLIRILTQCLLNQPDPAFRNLANLRHLITAFDAHTMPTGQIGKLDRFVLNATQNDPGTLASYQAFVNGNLKAIQSVLMTADVALDPIATPDMAALTATNSISFDELRQQPTALYLMVNQTQLSLYGFLLNLFYADLFRHLLRNQNNPGRPVWCFLDEFGHLQIPGFEVVATTARKYKAAFAIFLQSAAQLEGRYGSAHARTIMEAIGTEIYLPGVALDTARSLEARLGANARKPLMDASEIIRMKEHQALVLHSNRLPTILKTRRYFQQWQLRQRARCQPAPLPIGSVQFPRLVQL